MGGGGRGAHERLADDIAGNGGGGGVSVRGRYVKDGIRTAAEEMRAEDTWV